MSRWLSGWSRAVTNNAVPRSFLHLEVVSTLLQRLNLLALRLRQHNLPDYCHRNDQELLHERGIKVSHGTLREWC